ncbi:MAG: VWA domain-containing protein [Halioglobus sp.]
MIKIERSIFGHLSAFTRTLHDAGVLVDPGRLIDYCISLELTGFDDRETFYATSRAILVSRQDDITLFDKVFHSYWSGKFIPSRARDSSDPVETEEGEPDVGDKTVTVQEDTPHDENEELGRESETRGYSSEEVLMKRNLATLSEAEMEEAQRIVQRIVELIATYRSRRKIADKRGKEIDFRKVLRRNVLRGRDGIELYYRNRRIKKTRLVLLCDISGSMEAYSHFTIQFMCALRHVLPQLDVAVFSTRMTVITDLLDKVGVAESLQRVSDAVPDWSGGTDIGRCIRQFNDHFDRSIAHGKTVAVILSDGWDLGESGLMRQEMQHLHRNVHKLIWLNPLLGDAEYQPVCKGMRTAMPYIDHFMPAHNLESLAALAQTLRSV